MCKPHQSLFLLLYLAMIHRTRKETTYCKGEYQLCPFLRLQTLTPEPIHMYTIVEASDIEKRVNDDIYLKSIFLVSILP